MTYYRAMRASFICIARHRLIQRRYSLQHNMTAARWAEEIFLSLSEGHMSMDIVSSRRQHRQELALRSAANQQRMWRLISCKSSCPMSSRHDDLQEIKIGRAHV